MFVFFKEPGFDTLRSVFVPLSDDALPFSKATFNVVSSLIEKDFEKIIFRAN